MTAVHTGAPILTDCLTWFDCTVHNRVDAGDHIMLIGQVQAFGTSPSAPLGFCRGRYASVKDPLPAGWLASHGMVVGYLIEADGHILLRADGKGGWVLPSARRRKADNELDLDDGEALTLLADEHLPLFGLRCCRQRPRLPDLSRPAVEGVDGFALPADLRFFPIDALPYDAIPAREVRAMLRRYAARAHDAALRHLHGFRRRRTRRNDRGRRPQPWQQADSEQSQNAGQTA